MRFVWVKSAEQQGQLIQHRTRDLLIRQRTQVINALRAHMAELGIVVKVISVGEIVAADQVRALDGAAGAD
jgi:transposase